MSLAKAIIELFHSPLEQPESRILYARHCYAVTSRRARIALFAMLSLLGLLVLLVDAPAYFSGALFRDSVMQQMFWWRIAFIAFIGLALSLNAVILKRETHDRVFSWTCVVTLPLIGAAFCVICHPLVPDVSIFVLLAVAVAAVFPLSSMTKLWVYPVSLFGLIAGLMLTVPEADTVQHSAVIAASGILGAIVIDLIARQGFASDFAKSHLLARRERVAGGLVENVFPPAIADRLLTGHPPIVEQHEFATVLFAEFAGFAELTKTMKVGDSMGLLDDLFLEFDEAAARFGVSKIKTSGDCYVAACGLPEDMDNHVERAAEFALRIRSIAQRFRSDRDLPVHIRVGMHCGPVISGVIGRQRYGFDVWGDTVNTASQLRSLSALGGIHVSAATRDALGRTYSFSVRDPIRLKGRPPVQTYYLVGRAIDRDAVREKLRMESTEDSAPNSSRPSSRSAPSN